MAGIVATLRYKTIAVPGGYVEISSATGGPSYEASEQFPDGRWTIYLKYYISRESRIADINDVLLLGDQSYLSFDMPYVRGSDPVEAGLIALQSWFPDGIIVY